MNGLLVDAGPLYALADRDDAFHHPSLDLLSTHPGPLIVPTLVITCAERRRATEIATVDRRHFGAVRPSHRESFVLLPA